MNMYRKPEIVEQALKVCEELWKYRKDDFTVLHSPKVSRDYFRLHLTGEKDEVFSVAFLDNRHRLIAVENLFRGTIDGCSIHPRVVARRALELNAVAVIFAHNHPSGIAEPSRADCKITDKLKEALGLLEIRVLDHLVVGEEIVSMAERGLV